MSSRVQKPSGLGGEAVPECAGVGLRAAVPSAGQQRAVCGWLDGLSNDPLCLLPALQAAEVTHG